MIHFTKYAEKKFDILNKYKVYFTREQVENAINNPDKINQGNKYITAYKDDTGVIYEKDNGTNKIITFFPIK